MDAKLQEFITSTADKVSFPPHPFYPRQSSRYPLDRRLRGSQSHFGKEVKMVKRKIYSLFGTRLAVHIQKEQNLELC
jgi:hypothetical protein